MRILYDGWSLVHTPLSPQSLHLLSILENLPAEVQPVLALPDNAPGWLDFPGIEIIPTPHNPWGRLVWEQHRLPSFASKIQADLLHLFSPSAPYLKNPATVVSPAGFSAAADSKHIIDRVRVSLGLGALVGVSKILWPDDLPEPVYSAPLERLPPIIPQGFARRHNRLGEEKMGSGDLESSLIEQLKLPADFILYPGAAGRRHLEILTQAWNWAAPAIGELFPLLLVGLGVEDRQFLSEQANLLDFGESLRVLPGVTPPMLPALYRRSAAIFNPGQDSPWCGPVRLALASGKPFVAAENSLSAAVAGPAAYLVKENDARGLGAALVSVVVEQELGDSLSAAARRRSRGWTRNNYGDLLLGMYLSLSRTA